VKEIVFGTIRLLSMMDNGPYTQTLA